MPQFIVKSIKDASCTKRCQCNVYQACATIDHNRFCADNATLLGLPPDSIGRLNDYIAHNLETTRSAFKAGVRFAMGSDAVGNMFGENTREFGWFIKAGMTPEKALKAATADATALLGMEDKLGYLKPDFHSPLRRPTRPSWQLFLKRALASDFRDGET